MRLRRLLLPVVVVGLCLGVACGKSPASPTPTNNNNGNNNGNGSTSTPDPQPALTADQTRALEGTFIGAENALTSPALDELQKLDETATSFTASANCDGGGTVMVSGPLTPIKDGAGNVTAEDFNWSIAFSNCAANGVVLSGALGTGGHMSQPAENTALVTFSITGSNTFSVAGRTGTASFNCSNRLTIDFDSNTPTLVADGTASLQYPTGQNPATAPCSDFATGFTNVFAIGAPRLLQGR
jgi:hypothetical protein